MDQRMPEKEPPLPRWMSVSQRSSLPASELADVNGGYASDALTA